MTPYKLIAFDVLTTMKGFEKKKAKTMTNLLTIDQLETHIHAKSSINCAIENIFFLLGLTKEEKELFINAIYNGPLDSPIFKRVSELIEKVPEKESFVLGILTNIHNEWVKNNNSEEIFDKKREIKELEQYTPLPFIGYNTVKSDLLFLKPILDACNLDTDKLLLEGTYHNRLKQFLLINKIYSLEDLKKSIEKGQLFYPSLSIDLSNKVISHSNEVTNQIWENWNENDRISAITFLTIQRDKLIQERDHGINK